MTGAVESGAAVMGESVAGALVGADVGANAIGAKETGGTGDFVGLEVEIIGALVGTSWERQES